MATPNTLPKEWQDLGARQGFEPEPVENLRMLVLGSPGQGKTTFVSSIPNSLTLDFESGSHSVVQPRGHRISVRDKGQYDAVMKKLIADAVAKAPIFKTIVFETGDSWADLLIQGFINELRAAGKDIDSIEDYGSKGAGYGIIRSQALNDLNSLYFNNYSWIVTGHLSEKSVTIGGKDVTVIRPSMFPSLAKAIWARADVVGSMEKKLTITTTKLKKKLPNGREIEVPGPDVKATQYVFGLEGTNAFEGKARLPQLPEAFAIPQFDGWQIFVDAYNKAALADSAVPGAAATQPAAEGKE